MGSLAGCILTLQHSDRTTEPKRIAVEIHVVALSGQIEEKLKT